MITTVIIDWRERRITYLGDSAPRQFDNLHFESLYECLCLALAMGYRHSGENSSHAVLLSKP